MLFVVFVLLAAGVIWLFVATRRRVEADQARVLHERIRAQREQYAAERRLLAMAQQALQQAPDTDPAPNATPADEWYHEPTPGERLG